MYEGVYSYGTRLKYKAISDVARGKKGYSLARPRGSLLRAGILDNAVARAGLFFIETYERYVSQRCIRSPECVYPIALPAGCKTFSPVEPHLACCWLINCIKSRAIQNRDIVTATRVLRQHFQYQCSGGRISIARYLMRSRQGFKRNQR